MKGRRQMINLLLAFLSFVLVASTLLWMMMKGVFFCPWKVLTGYACPLCGGTRATVLLLCGDVVGAINMNPGVVVSVLASMFWGVYRLLRPRITKFKTLRIHVRWLVLMLFMANWVYLILRMR